MPGREYSTPLIINLGTISDFRSSVEFGLKIMCIIISRTTCLLSKKER